MTENRLTAYIAAFLRDALAEFRLESPSGALRPFTVFEGFLPAKRTSSGDDYPFAIVRPTSGTMGITGTSCSVDILFGIYDQVDDGYKTVINVMRRSVNALLTMPSRTLGGRFILEGDVTWEISDEQPYPAFVLAVHTEWTFRTPEIVMEGLGSDVTGYGSPVSSDVVIRNPQTCTR